MLKFKVIKIIRLINIVTTWISRRKSVAKYVDYLFFYTSELLAYFELKLFYKSPFPFLETENKLLNKKFSYSQNHDRYSTKNYLCDAAV